MAAVPWLDVDDAVGGLDQGEQPLERQGPRGRQVYQRGDGAVAGSHPENSGLVGGCHSRLCDGASQGHDKRRPTGQAVKTPVWEVDAHH